MLNEMNNLCIPGRAEIFLRSLCLNASPPAFQKTGKRKIYCSRAIVDIMCVAFELADACFHSGSMSKG